jgi:hypothetical protein
MSSYLRTKNLYVDLAPEIDEELEASAKREELKPSWIITYFIERNELLLRLTRSRAFRDVLTGASSLKALDPQHQRDAERVLDLVTRVREQKAYRLSHPLRRRCHFVISRHAKELLRKVADYHEVDQVDVVETLLILGLSDAEIGRR